MQISIIDSYETEIYYVAQTTPHGEVHVLNKSLGGMTKPNAEILMNAFQKVFDLDCRIVTLYNSTMRSLPVYHTTN